MITCLKQKAMLLILRLHIYIIQEIRECEAAVGDFLPS
jgi:hypothetical protein